MPLFGSYPSQIAFGVVAGAELRHSALLWSMLLSNRKAFGTLTQTNGCYDRTPRCFLRISLRIHHIFIMSERQYRLPRATTVWLLPGKHVLAFVANRQPLIEVELFAVRQYMLVTGLIAAATV
ncbi:hypothetical protein [Pantoea phage PA-1]